MCMDAMFNRSCDQDPLQLLGDTVFASPFAFFDALLHYTDKLSFLRHLQYKHDACIPVFSDLLYTNPEAMADIPK